MKRLRDLRSAGPRKVTALLIASYVSDWAILVALAVIGLVLGNIKPNQRPFSLEDPDISFPYTEKETVSPLALVMCSVVVPIFIVAFVALVLVPGNTVPRGTPKSLVWKRKLWELHAGWLGLATSLVAAWFITNGMKNLFGKPRPDLLARCSPDLEHVAKYVVGGLANTSSNGQLVSAAICTNTDLTVLNDGFRSFPSGHSSSSAAGLIYLSLFIASKFAITLPFLAPAGHATDADSYSAFPSRLRRHHLPRLHASHTDHHHHHDAAADDDDDAEEVDEDTNEQVAPAAASSSLHQHLAQHTAIIAAARRQAAAPPLYLLVTAALPSMAAVFIASSRWFDFRHHGFDILFGFTIGLVTAFFAFRYYHLPLRHGAGWAWGPRCPDKAFWAGMGSYSYATAKFDLGVDDLVDQDGTELAGGRATVRGKDIGRGCGVMGDEEQALGARDGLGAGQTIPNGGRGVTL